MLFRRESASPLAVSPQNLTFVNNVSFRTASQGERTYATNIAERK